MTEAENYLRKFLKKLRDFKEKSLKQAAQKPSTSYGRTATPSNPTRSPSKARNIKKKASNQQLSESSPTKDQSNS